MKDALINKFDKVIHDVKRIANEISIERSTYHKKLDKLKIKHDKGMSCLISELNEVLLELYDIYSDTDNIDSTQDK